MPWTRYWKECRVLRPWNATSRFSSGEGDEEQARGPSRAGLRHVEAPLGDLVAALDQVRRRAQHPAAPPAQANTPSRITLGNSSWRSPVVNGPRLRPGTNRRNGAPVN